MANDRNKDAKATEAKADDGVGVAMNAASEISEEEQREILRQIDGITEKNRKALSEEARADGDGGFGSGKRGALFQALVNAFALIALAGGFFALHAFQSGAQAQAREGSGGFSLAERAMIETIRAETGANLAAADREIGRILGSLNNVESQLRYLAGLDRLTDEQAANRERLLGLQAEHGAALARARDERSRILEEARADESDLQARREARRRERLAAETEADWEAREARRAARRERQANETDEERAEREARRAERRAQREAEGLADGEGRGRGGRGEGVADGEGRQRGQRGDGEGRPNGERQARRAERERGRAEAEALAAGEEAYLLAQREARREARAAARAAGEDAGERRGRGGGRPDGEGGARDEFAERSRERRRAEREEAQVSGLLARVQAADTLHDAEDAIEATLEFLGVPVAGGGRSGRPGQALTEEERAARRAAREARAEMEGRIGEMLGLGGDVPAETLYAILIGLLENPENRLAAQRAAQGL